MLFLNGSLSITLNTSPICNQNTIRSISSALAAHQLINIEPILRGIFQQKVKNKRSTMSLPVVRSFAATKPWKMSLHRAEAEWQSPPSTASSWQEWKESIKSLENGNFISQFYHNFHFARIFRELSSHGEATRNNLYWNILFLFPRGCPSNVVFPASFPPDSR